MGMENYTQFGIDVGVKNDLDKFKAMRKGEILLFRKKKKRLVTNTDAIAYLLFIAKKKGGA
jgi:hypothetical protein